MVVYGNLLRENKPTSSGQGLKLTLEVAQWHHEKIQRETQIGADYVTIDLHCVLLRQERSAYCSCRGSLGPK